MSILFKPRKSALGQASGASRYYPQLITHSSVDIYEIARQIAQVSALSQGDVISVLTNLSNVMKCALLNGQSVQIKGIGSFTLSAKCSGRGVASPTEVNAQQIKKVHICFREEQQRSGGRCRHVFTDGVRFVRCE